MENNVQQNLAKFIVNCRYDLIDQSLINDMKYRIIDWLGCVVTGVDYPQIQTSRRFFAEQSGKEEALIIGIEGKYPAASAAMVNGMIGHVSELDDGHRRAIGHPGSVTLPVALALAETFNVTSKDFLKALIIGYDLFIRMGQSVNPSHYAFWHTTGTCGAFAATATAASLMKLTEEQTANALGIAATLTSGLVASFGTHSKALNIGHACQNAVYAASLAKQGFTGSQDAITGEKGFIRATSRENKHEILNGISERNLLSNTAFFKVYASCGHTNSPLDVMFKMLNAYPLSHENIKSINVETYQIAASLTGELKAENEDEAKFSLPYCLAVAIIFGKVSLQEFEPDILSNPEVRKLAEKVKVVESPEATANFPKRQARVMIVTVDGRTYSDSVTDASDTIDFNVIEKKFLDAARSINRKDSETVLAYIKEMNRNKSLEPLLHYLRLI